MKCILLAAGYATRLYPLTENLPKSLLEVDGKTILDHIVNKIEAVHIVNEIVIVTNHKFIDHFENWRETYRGAKKITVLDDGSISNETRLGAINDVLFAVKYLNIYDSLMILAGDNLFEFGLDDFVDYYQSVGTDCITAHKLEDIEKLKRTGVAEVDAQFRLVSFEEKPIHPKSSYAVPPFYIYQKETIPLIEEFINEGNNGDAPGMVIDWLLKRKVIHVFHFKGSRYDIGTLDSYNEIKSMYKTNSIR
ncbi:nucleotidyltransferase family protein [Proteiniclasticum ruminis]|uniref:Glucose-1-phosphate thymidylyltransferase n=1 Tax=Proteiniclasticum ruminis TaxID=398199 RepID=A0A1G8JNI4_9CLOT|nr:nucleotidyltransferase family protein [Proteiniclasticum ruminis]SDI32849.1 glucose-1-phosphate thymidylyltransferase [Proteiniclasticum ruminis]